MVVKVSKKKVTVKGITISYKKIDNNEFISLTDISRYKNRSEPKYVVKNWIRSKETINFLGVWEKLNNPDF